MKWYELSIGHVSFEERKLYIKGNIESIMKDLFVYGIELTPVTNKKKIGLIETIISQNAKISNLELDLGRAKEKLDIYKSQLK